MDTIIPFCGVVILLLSWFTTKQLLPRIRLKNLRDDHADQPGHRKAQSAAVPYGAGLACIGGVLLPVAIGGLLIATHRLTQWPDILGNHIDGLATKLPLMLAILVGAGVLAVMGRRDDQAGLGIAVRLAIQVSVAVLFAVFGARGTLFMNEPVLQIALTVSWILFVTNAINFIDNTDGVMPMVALCATTGIFLIAALDGQLFVAAFALALMGTLIGVLPFNWHPASVYMGDEGSMPLGFLLATLAILLTTAGTGARSVVAPFVVPLLLLAVPIIDATFVITRRIYEGRSPAMAGRDHLAHTLSNRGWTAPQIARFAGAFSLQTSGMAVFAHGDDAAHLLIAASLGLSGITLALRRKKMTSEKT